MNKLKFVHDEQRHLLTITYPGEQALEFDMSLFKSTARVNLTDVKRSPFLLINRFIETVLTPEECKALYDIYKAVLETHTDIETLNRNLQLAIVEVSKIVTLEKMHNWVKYFSYIPIPQDLRESFDDYTDKTLITKDRTYVRDDYIELITWTLCLRFVAPIWSFYSDNTKRELGNKWHLYYTFILIDKSAYHGKQEENHPHTRLDRYIRANIPSSVNLDSIILNGFSQEDYPKYLLTLTVISRMIMFDLESSIAESSIIKIIYGYVNQKVSQAANQLGNVVREREPQRSGSTTPDQNVTNVLEGLNSRDLIEDGTIAMIEVYLSDIYNVARKLDPTIPDDIIQQSISNIGVISEIDFQDVQITLMKWVINKIIPYKAMDYVDRASLINAIIAVRAWMWHKGIYDLATVMTAEVDDTKDISFFGTSGKVRIPNELAARMRASFPYYRKPTGKIGTHDNKYNALEESARFLEDMIREHNWKHNLPETWGDQRNRGYILPDAIKISIIEMALMIANEEQ